MAATPLTTLLAGCVAERAQVRTDELSRPGRGARRLARTCSCRRPWWRPAARARWAR